MFTVTLPDGKYYIRIKKNPKKQPYYKKVCFTILKLIGQETITKEERTFSRNKYEEVAHGTAFVHKNDKNPFTFNKFLGYRIAFTRALELANFSREERKLFWLGYYNNIQVKKG